MVYVVIFIERGLLEGHYSQGQGFFLTNSF